MLSQIYILSEQTEEIQQEGQERLLSLYETSNKTGVSKVYTKCRNFMFQNMENPYPLSLSNCKEIVFDGMFRDKTDNTYCRGVGYNINLDKLFQYIIDNKDTKLDFVSYDFVL